MGLVMQGAYFTTNRNPECSLTFNIDLFLKFHGIQNSQEFQESEFRNSREFHGIPGFPKKKKDFREFSGISGLLVVKITTKKRSLYSLPLE
jgi:hypothetical protein